MRYRRVLSIWRRLELWLGMLSEPGATPPPTGNKILLENGNGMLAENGNNLILE